MSLGVVDGYLRVIPDEESHTITLAGSTDSTHPLAILGYEADLVVRSVVHDLLGGGIGAALVSPRPRAGQLSLLYRADSDALESVAFHRNPGVFTLTSAARPGIGMTYVVVGSDIRITLDPTTTAWTVTVPFQEVET